jgi:cobalamin-dependent methionine synthase I
MVSALNHSVSFGRVLTMLSVSEEHDNYAVEFIKATSLIKQKLPGAKVRCR